MCWHCGERIVKVRVLDHKGEKTPAYFSFDGYEPETNIVYQFYECHWHGYTCQKNCAIRQKMRYKYIWII